MSSLTGSGCIRGELFGEEEMSGVCMCAQRWGKSIFLEPISQGQQWAVAATDEAITQTEEDGGDSSLFLHDDSILR